MVNMDSLATWTYLCMCRSFVRAWGLWGSKIGFIDDMNYSQVPYCSRVELKVELKVEEMAVLRDGSLDVLLVAQ